MQKLIILTLLGSLLACSTEPDPEPDARSETAEKSERDHFLSDQYQALDDAKKLQDDLNAQVEQRLKELDEQSEVKQDDN